MDPPTPLGRQTDELLMLFRESAAFHADRPEVAAVLAEAEASVRRARTRLHWSHDSYAVAFVGLSNVGKSTLINALLGDEYSPRLNGPCTASAIEFVHGLELRITCRSRGKLRPWVWECDKAAAVRRRLESLAREQFAGRTEVRLPSRFLATGLRLIDTPGFGAAQQQENGADPHEAALADFLRTAAAQVFWVVLAEQGITDREYRFYRDRLTNVCDDIVVTGCDDWSAADRERFHRRFAELFPGRLPSFHFVSGKAGLQASRISDQAQWEQSGLAGLDRRLRDLAEPGTRGTRLEEDLREMLGDLTTWLTEYRDSQGMPLDCWWRPDSFARWRLAAASHPLGAVLKGNAQGA